METLPKDIVEKIGNELSIRDFLNFCKRNPKCDRNVWTRRFRRDFGYLDYEYTKENYLDVVNKISSTATKIVENMFENMKFQRRIFEPFRNEMIQFFFDAAVDLMKIFSEEDLGENLDDRSDLFFNILIEYRLTRKIEEQGYIPSRMYLGDDIHDWTYEIEDFLDDLIINFRYK